MKKLYLQLEKKFEKIAAVASAVLGNSIVFIIALIIVIYWLSEKEFYQQDAHERIRDLIHSITFLSLFLIQKAFNRFSASLHLKVNELVISHEPASNAVIHHGEEKTERELDRLSKEYIELAKEANVQEEKS